ncbi:MAG: 4-hydroxythreonine-4-phosphate dehydrogenase PdxA [Candidatus Gastranaerophilales bacterium]|nr:4-hydroxythreonine-4-phosphate dehydrogenase PdxA [Candidatus Gastranaerophilales bacterium]
MKSTKKIAITTGDVNGIGAEVTIKALKRLNLPKENVILVSNTEILEFYGSRLGFLPQQHQIIEIPFDKNNIQPGELTKVSGEFSFQALKKACEIAKNGEIDSIVTAPTSKEAMHLAGHKFNGQTEILQHFLAHNGQHAEMLFVANDFRVLLLTRHVSLKEISLTKDEVIKKISDLDKFFKEKFKINTPKFALCGFNPHAGEGGILGREEIEILQPAVNELRAKGIDITNPIPADTLFIKAAKNYLTGNRKQRTGNSFLPSCPLDLLPSCYIACYHDQGLIPIKTVASEKTVNMTIGLDVIRTSPCHGTAFDIAGKNSASENSMMEAIKQAI